VGRAVAAVLDEQSQIQLRQALIRWERFDKARTWAAVTAFALFLTTMAIWLAAH
jgi:hypothetical protein